MLYIKEKAKSFIMQMIRSAGLSVSPLASLPHVALADSIDLILDVGANCGQFALNMRSAGYRNRIVSFEPLQQAHNIHARRGIQTKTMDRT